MEKQEKLYLNGNGKRVNLKSGDEGMMIKFTIEDLERILKENPEVKRNWESPSGGTGNDVVFFVMPRKTPLGSFTHYIEIIRPSTE